MATGFPKQDLVPRELSSSPKEQMILFNLLWTVAWSQQHLPVSENSEKEKTCRLPVEQLDQSQSSSRCWTGVVWATANKKSQSACLAQIWFQPFFLRQNTSINLSYFCRQQPQHSIANLHCKENEFLSIYSVECKLCAEVFQCSFLPAWTSPCAV